MFAQGPDGTCGEAGGGEGPATPVAAASLLGESPSTANATRVEQPRTVHILTDTGGRIESNPATATETQPGPVGRWELSHHDIGPSSDRPRSHVGHVQNVRQLPIASRFRPLGRTGGRLASIKLECLR